MGLHVPLLGRTLTWLTLTLLRYGGTVGYDVSHCSTKIKMSHFSKVEMSPESSRKRLPSLMSGVHPTGRKLVKDASGGMFYAERIGLKTVSMAISERGYPAE